MSERKLVKDDKNIKIMIKIAKRAPKLIGIIHKKKPLFNEIPNSG